MHLIPFAYRKGTEQLVDVYDVPSGKKCDCYCPSCKIPLIAKKGEVREWYFSHDPAFYDSDTHTCDFSWLTSVKLMIKQLLVHTPILCLPEYVLNRMVITKSQTLTFDRVETGSSPFDLYAHRGAHKLGVTFDSHIKRAHQLSGVIQIDPAAFKLELNLKQTSFKQHLASQLQTTRLGKVWLFHQREKTLEATTSAPADTKKAVITPNNAHQYQHRPHLACRQCDTRFLPVSKTAKPSCPECNSPFYQHVFVG